MCELWKVMEIYTSVTKFHFVLSTNTEEAAPLSSLWQLADILSKVLVWYKSDTSLVTSQIYLRKIRLVM